MFGWIRAKKRNDSPETAPPAVEDQIAEAVEARVRVLRQEWYEVLERLERTSRRIAKRQEREAEANGSAEPEAPATASAASSIIERVNRRRHGGQT